MVSISKRISARAESTILWNLCSEQGTAISSFPLVTDNFVRPISDQHWKQHRDPYVPSIFRVKTNTFLYTFTLVQTVVESSLQVQTFWFQENVPPVKNQRGEVNK